MAVQRTRGEFLAFLGAEMRPLLGDVPKGVRTARSVSGHTVATRECTVMTHPDTASWDDGYRVGIRLASSIWYVLTADLAAGGS
jgi:hypothetical protein